jgi:hypothetical protein
MAIYRVTRTSTPNLAPAAGSLVPGQLAVEMATQPNPRLWVGVPTNIDPTGRRLIVATTGGGGGGGIPDAPTDGQIYGRNGETELWVPVLPLTGGTMQGTLVLNSDVSAPLDAMPFGQLGTILGFPISATAPVSPDEGSLWYNTNIGQLTVWNGSQWVPSTGFLPLGGGQMTGNLILDGPPSEGGDPDQAATRGYVDSHITGAVQFIGTINAPSGNVTYTESSGITFNLPTGGTTNVGPLVNPTGVKDTYVICSAGGVIPPTSPYLVGVTMTTGDWAISDGTQWYVIQNSGMEVLAEAVAVSPTVLGASNVQSALEALLTNFSLYAPIISPGLQGIPTTPTPPSGDFSLQIANTAWVEAQIQKALQGAGGDLDAILLIGNLNGSNLQYQGSGEFFDDITLAGDGQGTSGSTAPNFITAVQLTVDATGT